VIPELCLMMCGYSDCGGGISVYNIAVKHNVRVIYISATAKYSSLCAKCSFLWSAVGTM